MLNFDQITALCEMFSTQYSNIGLELKFVKRGKLSPRGAYDFRSWHIVSNVYSGPAAGVLSTGDTYNMHYCPPTLLELFTGTGETVGVVCPGSRGEKTLTVEHVVDFVKMCANVLRVFPECRQDCFEGTKKDKTEANERREAIGRNWHLTQYPG